jgi:hypothetical protein
MPKINWIKGELRGKLGEIVGSSWKGKGYVKTYTKPRNPNTPAQQSTRYLFQNLSRIGKAIYKSLELYTRPTPHGMTAYNNLLKLNKPLFEKEGVKWNPLELTILSGDLTAAAITIATFDSTTFEAAITWDGTLGDATDKAFIVIYDNESKKTVYTTEIARSAGTCAIDDTIFANTSFYSDLYAYLAFYHINADGTGLNSNTTVLKVVTS